MASGAKNCKLKPGERLVWVQRKWGVVQNGRIAPNGKPMSFYEWPLPIVAFITPAGRRALEEAKRSK